MDGEIIESEAGALAGREPGEKPLTVKQRTFIFEYLKDGIASRACIRAGYSKNGSGTTGAQLLKHPRIKAIILQEEEKQRLRLTAEADQVIKELIGVATTDIRHAFDYKGNLLPLNEMPEGIRKAIQSVEVEAIYTGKGLKRHSIGNTIKIKLWDKLKSLEMLGKHLKLFGETDQEGKAPNLKQVNINIYPAGPAPNTKEIPITIEAGLVQPGGDKE